MNRQRSLRLDIYRLIDESLFQQNAPAAIKRMAHRFNSIQVKWYPAYQVFPHESSPRISPRTSGEFGDRVFFVLQDFCKHRQKRCQVVGFSRWSLSNCAPKAGYAVLGLSTQFTFAAQIYGCVWKQLKEEQFGVVLNLRQLAQLKRIGQCL